MYHAKFKVLTECEQARIFGVRSRTDLKYLNGTLSSNIEV